MPSLTNVYYERSKSKHRPPPSPAAAQSRRHTGGAGGGWSRVRALSSFPTGLTRSPSSSDIESGHGGPSKSSSQGGGGSLTVSKIGGGGGKGPGGGGGGVDGGGGDDEGKNGGRYGYALKSYERVNKPRPYREVAAEVVAKGASMPKKRLVSLLRELCIRIGDNSVCDGAFFGTLLEILRSAKDGDWDGKTVRLVHFFVRGMVTVQGDTEGRALGSQWEGRGITEAQILQAIECFREETEHRSTLRQLPAFQTVAMLCQLACEAGISGYRSPLEMLKEATLAPLKSLRAQDRPDRGEKRRSKGFRHRLENFQGGIEISSSIFSAIRRCPPLARDGDILHAVIAGCCSENPIAARHAFAILADQATQCPEEVSKMLLSKAMLIPTTVGMLQAPVGSGAFGNVPNLTDSLACVYYLRAIKALAFAEALDDTMRLDMYRTMVSSVPDARHRVALEAMQCLLDHPRAWELLVNAQRESRDADIFRRVVNRIKLCVEEATAPAAAALASGAGAAAAAKSTPGKSVGKGRFRSRSLSPTRAAIGDAGSGGCGEDGGSAPVMTAAADGAQCNWALAHAACRVCRVVGRTFQVAISYQTMQSQNRTGSDGRFSTLASEPDAKASSAPNGAPGTHPSPPPVKVDFGSGGHDRSKGGEGAPVAPLAKEATSGAAFNLLGLTPSPAPTSGVRGASAWGETVSEGLWGRGDVIAGQVVEEQNTAAIQDLCRVLQQQRLLESPHLHVRSLALEAMFLLVPDPSPLDPQLRGLWDWLQQRVQQCPSTLPVSVLSDLVDTLLTRVQCSAASRQEVIPIALSLTESFMYQVPSEEMGRCLLRAWSQCVGYGGRAREAVLQSVYRLLDTNIALPPEASRHAAATSKDRGSASGFDQGTFRERHVRGRAIDGLTRHSTAVFKAPAGAVNGGSAILGGEEVSRWGKSWGGAEDWRTSARLLYLRERSAATRMKRSAYWFLGEYCRQLTGLPAERDGASSTLNPSPPPKPTQANADLLDVWKNSVTPARSASGSLKVGGFDGADAAVGSGTVAHPVVSAMNGATVSILLRLKHASMFEDFQTRYTCASALCKIALRLPEPVRFDAYCFLKTLTSSADMFPLVAPRGEIGAGPECHLNNGHRGDVSLQAYHREQEALMERIEAAGAFGIGEVLTPVLDYLDCVYARPDENAFPEETLASTAREQEFLDMYRRLLDGRGAARSP